MRRDNSSTYTDSRISRRTLLKGVVAGGALTQLAGVGTAQENDEPPKRYVVGTVSSEDGLSGNSENALQATEARATSVEKVLDFDSVGRAVVADLPESAIEELRKEAGVRYVEPEIVYHGAAQETPWGIDRIDADQTTADGYIGSGADIAILDSGIDNDHPDLEGNLGEGKSFLDYTDSWDDDLGHGTKCAGIVAAVNNSVGFIGVAPSATLHAGKVLNEEDNAPTSAVADGLRWVADQGYEVASVSLGGPRSSYVINDAVEYASDQGVLIVASAGNDYGGDVNYPAAYSEVIAVSGTTESDDLARFSSTGPEVELAAPGEDVRTTNRGDYGYFSGTSAACPHVSAVGGLLMSADGGGLSNSKARQRLQDTAEDIGLSSDEQGYGLVDAAAAVPASSSQNILTIDGTGNDASYTFSVTEQLQKSTANGAGINSADAIHRDYVADGSVSGGADSYAFSGSLETFELVGDATVSLNGESLSTDEIDALPDHVIESYALESIDFMFSTDGDAEPQTLTANGTEPDSAASIRQTTVHTSTNSNVTFGFDGSLTSLNVSGDASIFLDGQEIDPTDYIDHVVTVVGGDGGASYRFSASSSLQKSTANFAGINSADTIRNNTARGSVVDGGADSYVFNGELSDRSINGNATFYKDAREVRGTTDSNTLTITSDSPCEYAFSVTGDLQKSTANGATIDDNDSVDRGYIGRGQVYGGIDSYTFTGELQTLRLSADADVSLNGESLSSEQVDRYPDNAIEIVGRGTPARYTFSVSGAREPEKLTVNGASTNGDQDQVSRTTARGTVGNGSDAFGFDGTIASLDAEEARFDVYVNGRQRFPYSFPDHVITVVGTGSRANYDFTVGSQLSKTTANFAGINSSDMVRNNTASGGVVDGGADSYVFEGELSRFAGDDAITVLVDGREVEVGNV